MARPRRARALFRSSQSPPHATNTVCVSLSNSIRERVVPTTPIDGSG